jgi:hypothetical protein
MERFEYMALTFSQGADGSGWYRSDADRKVHYEGPYQELIEILNGHGSRGWEVVGMHAGEAHVNTVLLKRRLGSREPHG